jgi:glycosyltransferase involved in cell wall biosynthesis
VIIPTYNRAALLRRQLESLCDQSVPRDAYEVIVADDGSTDDTAEVVAGFAGRLRVRYHVQADDGFRAALARNEGARLAGAPVLIFLDAGALAGSGLVQAHTAAHRSPDEPGVVVFGYAYGYRPNDPFPGLADLLDRLSPAEIVALHGDNPKFADERDHVYRLLGDDLALLHTWWMFCWSVNLSVRASDFWAVGGFYESLKRWGSEDIELGLRLARHGLRPVVGRDAWAVESPHHRDVAGNAADNRANAWVLWSRNPEPVTELYGAIYASPGPPPAPPEREYRAFLDWVSKVPEPPVDGEVRDAVDRAGLAAGRVVVLGAGDLTGLVAERSTVDWHVFDIDAAMPARYAIGLRTDLPDHSADLVVVTSRLAGLWPRWGEDIRAEAARLGARVEVAFDAAAVTA